MFDEFYKFVKLPIDKIIIVLYYISIGQDKHNTHGDTKMYIECEYVTKVEGKTLSVFYDGGYGWTAWLEGKGNIAWDFNAEDTIEEAQKKLGVDNLKFEYIKH